MEGFSECQATYLHKYGIHVSLIEPGPLLTEFPKTVDKENKLVSPDDAYSGLASELEKVISQDVRAFRQIFIVPTLVTIQIVFLWVH